MDQHDPLLRRLLLPGLVVVIVLGAWLATRLAAAPAGPQTVTRTAITFTSPGGWQSQEPMTWNYPDAENLWHALHASREARLTITRIPFWGTDALLESAAEFITDAGLEEDASIMAADWIEVGEQPAYQTDVSTAGNGGMRRIVYVLYDRHLYTFTLTAVDSLKLVQYTPDLDALLDSVAFH
jgi:hypothetical protein